VRVALLGGLRTGLRAARPGVLARPLADPLTALRLTLSSVSQTRTWRGRILLEQLGRGPAVSEAWPDVRPSPSARPRLLLLPPRRGRLRAMVRAGRDPRLRRRLPLPDSSRSPAGASQRDAPAEPRLPARLSGRELRRRGTFGAARELGRLGRPRVEAYGRDRIVVLGETGTRRPRAVVAFGPATGRLGTPRPLGPGIPVPSRWRPTRAATPWRSWPSARTSAAASRPGDRRPPRGPGLRRPGGDRRPAAGVQRHRRDQRPRRRARRLGAAAARAVRDPQRLRPHPDRGRKARLRAAARAGTPFVALRAAIGDGRRAVVAWLGQAVSEGDALGPATISFAVAAPGASFGPDRRLEVVGIRGTGRYVARPASTSSSARTSGRCWPGPASRATGSSCAPRRSPATPPRPRRP
jgi:hypothetical protein